MNLTKIERIYAIIEMIDWRDFENAIQRLVTDSEILIKGNELNSLVLEHFIVMCKKLDSSVVIEETDRNIIALFKNGASLQYDKYAKILFLRKKLSF